MVDFTKADEQVGGLPDGGSNGDILVRDDSSVGGYKWQTPEGEPHRITTSGATSISVIDSLNSNTYPWATDGNDALQGTIDGTIYLRGAVRGASAGTSYPGVTGDVILNFKDYTSNNEVHIMINGTVDGRDLSVDGSKLDTVQNGAQKNPSTVTSGEKNSPTSVTVLRSFSPNDIVDIASTIQVGNPTQISSSEIQNASSVTDLRSYSPEDVFNIVQYHTDGDPNYLRVTVDALKDPIHDQGRNVDALDQLRSFTPFDVYRLAANMLRGFDRYPNYFVEKGLDQSSYTNATRWQSVHSYMLPDVFAGDPMDSGHPYLQTNTSGSTIEYELAERDYLAGVGSTTASLLPLNYRDQYIVQIGTEIGSRNGGDHYIFRFPFVFSEIISVVATPIEGDARNNLELYWIDSDVTTNAPHTVTGNSGTTYITSNRLYETNFVTIRVGNDTVGGCTCVAFGKLSREPAVHPDSFGRYAIKLEDDGST